ncbi:MAG: hypothetical protein LBP64_06220 [Tannerella sp.]|nr:hypothetical protein [Tannerella sp.]
MKKELFISSIFIKYGRLRATGACAGGAGSSRFDTGSADMPCVPTPGAARMDMPARIVGVFCFFLSAGRGVFRDLGANMDVNDFKIAGKTGKT